MSSVIQEFILSDEIDTGHKESVEAARLDLFEADPRSLVLSDETEEDLNLVKQVSEKIQSSFKNLIIIGTGASESIPRVLFDLGKSKLNIRFLSAVNQNSVEKSLHNLDKRNTCVLSISKSGKTIETIDRTNCIIGWMQGDKSIDDIASRFFFITELKESPFLKIAQSLDSTIIRHSSIEGRFALFTSLGFLSASLAGFDIDKIISNVHGSFSNIIESDSWVMKGVSYNLSMNQKLSNNVFINYEDSFEGVNFWCRQLVSESLGKDYNSMKYISTRGSVDHNVQLKLYLDDPGNSFTVFFLDEEHRKESKTNNSKIWASQRIVDFEAIKNKDKNIRIISTKKVNERFIAEFFMGIMIEVIIFAYVKNIDPFSQFSAEGMKKEFIY